MSSQSTPLQAPPQLIDDEIDLREVAAALNRQKVLISGITLAAALISGIYAFTSKPVWRGGFQIVLENINGGSSSGRLAQLSSANPILSNLAGLGGSAGKSSLKTEIQILKSPSVLKPTYDFVKASKASAGKNVRNWTYQNWVKRNLSIELVKGTSVLNLAYQDTDKLLVLPVLKRITDTYQEYSGRDRQRGLTQRLEYIEQQLIKLQKQSNLSMRTAQAYALNNGLGIKDGLPALASSGGSPEMSVEGSREAAQNRVNALRQKIAAAKSVGGARLYKAPQLQANEQLYGQLQDVEAELKEKTALLTPRDQSIQALQRQRASLTAYINQQTIGLLQGELLTAEAELASLTRPREVVLKHRELLRTALREEKLLAGLETQLQTTRLDQARQTNPWELISTPTLLDMPVAPRKKRIGAFGIFGGLVLGCGAGLIRDRRSGLVFSEDELKASMPCPLLERLPAASPQHWSGTAQLLAEGPLSNVTSVGLLVMGQVLPEQIEQLSASLRNALGNNKLVVSSDPLLTRHVDTQILVSSLGVAQRRALQQLREQLALQGTPVAGWLLIDPELEA